jgi:hypothetical protein
MFPSREFALEFATTRSRAWFWIPHIIRAVPFRLFFCLFFCGLSAFSRFLNLRCHDARVEEEEEEENRTRERGRREKDDLNLEIKRMIHRAMREIRARGGRFLGRELCLFLFFDDF